MIKCILGLPKEPFNKSGCNKTGIFLSGVKNNQTPNFMKILSVGTDLLSGKIGSDMTKLIVAFRKFPNDPSIPTILQLFTFYVAAIR